MYQYVSKLIIYRKTKDSEILYSLSEIIRTLYEEFPVLIPEGSSKEIYITEIYEQINKLMVLATEYGFDNNLWKNYIAYLIAVSENPFSISCVLI
jgi:hypothetical protein